MNRLLIIDDDLALLAMLRRGFSYAGYAVNTAESGPAGLAIARDQPPDLVILDIMMPGMDGLDVLARLRAADAHLPVVLLTAKDAPTDQVAGLDAGADDYVVKPFTFEVLLARVRVLLRRAQDDHPIRLSYGDLILDTAAHLVRRGDRAIVLTNLELRLLREFLTHPEHVLPKEVLLERVWGYDFGGTGNIVEVYVKQLRQKLEDEGEPRLIHTIRNAGYILRAA
jgi:DNA-binding response OmpR family regulator